MQNFKNLIVRNRNIRMRIRGGARILVRGRGQRTKFHTLIRLKSCTAMASPKFRFGEIFSKNVLIKDLCKILKIFLKYLHKNLKFLQNFSKLKFNGI